MVTSGCGPENGKKVLTMDEYIDKGALYEEIAQLEELARNRYLDTPSNSPAYPRYMAQMQERTALKHLIADFPVSDVVPVRHGRWEIRGGKRYCTSCGERACVTRDSEGFWYTIGTPYCPNCGAKMDEEK